MKLKINKKVLTMFAVGVMLFNFNPKRVEAKSILDAVIKNQQQTKIALEKRESELSSKLEAYKNKGATNPFIPDFIENFGRKASIKITEQELKNLGKAIDNKPAISNPIGNFIGEKVNNLSNSRMYEDFAKLETGGSLPGEAAGRYKDAVGKFPKYQDISVPKSLSLLKKSPPKAPSVQKYNFKLPAPTLDKRELQNKFISGLNVEGDELMETAVEKFKKLQGMN